MIRWKSEINQRLRLLTSGLGGQVRRVSDSPVVHALKQIPQGLLGFEYGLQVVSPTKVVDIQPSPQQTGASVRRQATPFDRMTRAIAQHTVVFRNNLRTTNTVTLVPSQSDSNGNRRFFVASTITGVTACMANYNQKAETLTITTFNPTDASGRLSYTIDVGSLSGYKEWVSFGMRPWERPHRFAAKPDEVKEIVQRVTDALHGSSPQIDMALQQVTTHLAHLFETLRYHGHEKPLKRDPLRLSPSPVDSRKWQLTLSPQEKVEMAFSPTSSFLPKLMVQFDNTLFDIAPSGDVHYTNFSLPYDQARQQLSRVYRALYLLTREDGSNPLLRVLLQQVRLSLQNPTYPTPFSGLSPAMVNTLFDLFYPIACAPRKNRSTPKKPFSASPCYPLPNHALSAMALLDQQTPGSPLGDFGTTAEATTSTQHSLGEGFDEVVRMFMASQS